MEKMNPTYKIELSVGIGIFGVADLKNSIKLPKLHNLSKYRKYF